MNLELNDGQRAAVEYCDGPQLVIAGAGSGKTRVLTYKIAYLIDEKQYEPWSILALTFTNKAANEMRSRIARVVGQDRTRYLYMGTFHSIFSRILRVEAEKLGYSKQFTIYDESDSRSLLKSIIKEMQLDDKVYKPASVHAKISMAKNHLILPNAYAVDQAALKRDEQSHQGQIYQIYQTYQQRLQTANAM
ncbi:MAG: UvrD-helicase domain-containing protein, partial [Prevotella salivae]|nr:UvrD-helicase domain-containing protein [Segatella salivae]